MMERLKGSTSANFTSQIKRKDAERSGRYNTREDSTQQDKASARKKYSHSSMKKQTQASVHGLGVSARHRGNARYDTLATGGRYDNLIAQHQIYGDHEAPSKTPKGYNLTIFCNEIIQRLLPIQQAHLSYLDVFVTSAPCADNDKNKSAILKQIDGHAASTDALDESSSSSDDSLFEWAQEREGSLQEKAQQNVNKMKLVQELRALGIRAESDVQFSQTFWNLP